MKLFCFGFGQVAQSFVDYLLNLNVDLRLTTTSRKNTSELTFKNLNILIMNLMKMILIKI